MTQDIWHKKGCGGLVGCISYEQKKKKKSTIHKLPSHYAEADRCDEWTQIMNDKPD